MFDLHFELVEGTCSQENAAMYSMYYSVAFGTREAPPDVSPDAHVTMQYFAAPHVLMTHTSAVHTHTHRRLLQRKSWRCVVMLADVMNDG